MPYISSIVSYKMLAELPGPRPPGVYFTVCVEISSSRKLQRAFSLVGIHARRALNSRASASVHAQASAMGSHSNTKKACARSCAQTCCIRNTFFEEGALCLRAAACPKVHSAHTRGARLDRARFLLIFLVSRTRTLCFDPRADHGRAPMVARSSTITSMRGNMWYTEHNI